MKPAHGWPACWQDYRDVKAGKELPATLTALEYWDRLTHEEGRVLSHALMGLLHLEDHELITTLYIRFVALEPAKAQALIDARWSLVGGTLFMDESTIDGIMWSHVQRFDDAERVRQESVRVLHGYPPSYLDTIDSMYGRSPPEQLTPSQYLDRLTHSELRALLSALRGTGSPTSSFTAFVRDFPEKARALVSNVAG